MYTSTVNYIADRTYFCVTDLHTPTPDSLAHQPQSVDALTMCHHQREGKPRACDVVLISPRPETRNTN